MNKGEKRKQHVSESSSDGKNCKQEKWEPEGRKDSYFQNVQKQESMLLNRQCNLLNFIHLQQYNKSNEDSGTCKKEIALYE